MNYFHIGDTARRNDTGARVRVVDVRPNGLRVFYVCEHQDGHTAIFEHGQLRPDTQETTK